MGVVVFWVVHVLLLLSGSHGLEYDGAACTNIVNFELEAGTDISSIDGEVGAAPMRTCARAGLRCVIACVV
jgi:hypothetical protein